MQAPVLEELLQSRVLGLCGLSSFQLSYALLCVAQGLLPAIGLESLRVCGVTVSGLGSGV